MKLAMVAVLGMVLGACSTGNDHAQIAELQKQVGALSQRIEARNDQQSVMQLKQQIAALSLQVNSLTKPPTPAERAQACDTAQNIARKRIAEIRGRSPSAGAKYLNEVIENQRAQQQLIQMQIQIAESACASAYGVLQSGYQMPGAAH